MPDAAPDRALARKNVRLALAVLAALLVLALLPATCRRVREPANAYATVHDARAAGAPLPAFVPPSARDIHERHDAAGTRRFVRFAVDSADVPAMTAGMCRVPVAEVERMSVPTPGWSSWWTITSKTLQGSQGKRLHVYEVPGPDAGFLAVDPRSRLAFYWKR